ncbi:MAG TPA: PIG-L deacetylase family protein [Verrucomicrobiae bacterium]|nr:PIG-L deacetylase family protein [Verrucomicrobiae bacterium]
MNILIIAAHPDDEVLGMGGTIKKLSRKNRVELCVVSEGASAQYDDKNMILERKNACIKSGKILGLSDYHFLDFPDMKLDSIPHVEINIQLEKIISKYKPKIVYTTPENDMNKDHQRVFESTLIATRPMSSAVKTVYSYELPGLVKIPFNPVVYENITKEMLFKIKAFRMYASEIMKFPHPRSIKAIENLAIHRGIESGLPMAEAFQLIRSILD